jgi:hypothetical protein
MKKRVPITVAKAILLCCLLTAGSAASGKDVDSTRLRVRTLGVSFLGTAFVGVGITYDHSFAASDKGYWYCRGAFGCIIYGQDLFPLVGAGYCRSISKNKKFFVGAGVNVGALISLNPTPKALRDYWDSTGFYGGNYVYPVSWFIMPELSMGYMGKHWFSKLQFTPLVPYEKYGRNEFTFYPTWGGITVGIRFNKTATT